MIIPLHNKMVITPLFFWANWEIPMPKIIHCSRPTRWYQQRTLDMCHVSCVHKRVLELVNLFLQNLQKPYMIDLGTHSPLICDALWSICHIGGLCAPLQNYFAVLHLCGGKWPFSYLTSLFRTTSCPCSVHLVHFLDWTSALVQVILVRFY